MIQKDKKQSINVFKQILIDNWEAFKEKYPSYDTTYYNEVIEKVINCGNVKYGYREYTCLNCGQDRILVPFSCKSKFCLSCGKVFSDDITEKIGNKMYDGAIYRHLTLTIPEQCRIYFYRDRFKGELLKKFFKAGWECIQDVIKRVRRKELKCGCIMILHLCGRKGDYKPHLHALILEGGLDEESGEWRRLGYFPYEILHKSWQEHLFNMLEEEIETDEMSELISKLRQEYPDGLVANIKKGEVPERSKGLAKYLTKYISSPNISLRRIKKYDRKDDIVEYVYRSHETGKIEKEVTNIFTFIGRMVQQILPKGFQRIRYLGLQATKTFSKVEEALKRVFKSLKKIVKGCYKVVKKTYRDRYKEVNEGKDPFICSKCGHGMGITRIWSRTHGVIYDFFEELKNAPLVYKWRSNAFIKDKKEKKVADQQDEWGIQLVFGF